MKDRHLCFIFHVNGHEVEVIRKKVLHLRLTLYANGIIRLSAPKQASTAEIQSFLDSKSSWLEKSLAKIAENQSRPEPFLLSNRRLSLWGDEYKLVLHEQAERPYFSKHENIVEFFLPSPPGRLEFFITQLYAHEMEIKIAPLLDLWRKKMNLASIHYSIRAMKSRWGSCTPNTGRIRLNAWLASYPPQCLEYVLVHELCHFFEKNHGPGFYKLMDAYLPDWKNRRQILEQGKKSI